MSTDALFGRAGLTLRKVQQDFIEAATEALNVDNKIGLLSAETGVGKTLGYLVPALKILAQNPAAKFVIATNSHALMNQIFNSDRPNLEKMADDAGMKVTFSRLMGKTNYISQDKVRDLLLLNSACDQETIDTLNHLQNWSKTLVEFEEEYGVLPSGITQEMVTFSWWDEMLDRKEIRQQSLEADIVVTTHAMIMVDCLSRDTILGSKENMYLIIDEADMFVDMLESWKQRRFNIRDLLSAFSSHLTRSGILSIQQIGDDISTAAGGQNFCSTPEAVQIFENSFKTLAKVGRKIKDEAARTSFFDCIYGWEILGMSGGQKGVGVSRIRHEPALIAVNPFIGMNVGKYCTCWRSALLTSATLSITPQPETGTEWLCKALVLSGENISVRKIFSPESYGTMKLTIAGASYPRVFSDPKNQIISDKWLNAVTDALTRIPGPALVLTASHSETRAIAQRLGTSSQPVHAHLQGQRLSDIIQSFQQNPGILISAGASVGVSPRGKQGEQLFHNLVITRIPFSPPDRMKTESLHAYLIENGYSRTLESVNRTLYVENLRKVIRKGKQSVGRGIRSENDIIRVMILDPRFPEPENLSSKYRALEHIIPVRFRREYHSCEIISPAYCGEDIQC